MKSTIIQFLTILIFNFHFSFSQVKSSIVISSSPSGKFLVIDNIEEGKIEIVNLELESRVESFSHSFIPMTWFGEEKLIIWELKEKYVEILEFDVKNKIQKKLGEFTRKVYDDHLDFPDHMCIPPMVTKIEKFFVIFVEKDTFFRFNPLKNFVEPLFHISELSFAEIEPFNILDIEINYISLSYNLEHIIISMSINDLGYFLNVDIWSQSVELLYVDTEATSKESYIFSTRNEESYIFFQYESESSNINKARILLLNSDSIQILSELENILLVSMVEVPIAEKYLINTLSLNTEDINISSNILSDIAKRLKTSFSVLEIDYM